MNPGPISHERVLSALRGPSILMFIIEGLAINDPLNILTTFLQVADGGLCSSLRETLQDMRNIFLDDEVSVSPPMAPHTTEHHVALESLAETDDGSAGRP